MSKKTLLAIVQNILSDMDSDEVNSISDSVEALQVAEIVRSTYEDLVATLSIPERRSLVRLESLADTTKPNYLRIPEDVKDFMWIRYNSKEIDYLKPETFIDYVLNNTGPVTVTDFENVTYTIDNTKDPLYWSSFNDDYIVFSSFNQQEESTLQESKSIAYADMNRAFPLEDDFICDLDSNLYPLLISESKTSAFVNLKQVSNSKEEQRARRQLVRVQNELSRTAKPDPKDRLPNYGRRR